MADDTTTSADAALAAAIESVRDTQLPAIRALAAAGMNIKLSGALLNRPANGAAATAGATLTLARRKIGSPLSPAEQPGAADAAPSAKKPKRKPMTRQSVGSLRLEFAAPMLAKNLAWKEIVTAWNTAHKATLSENTFKKSVLREQEKQGQ